MENCGNAEKAVKGYYNNIASNIVLKAEVATIFTFKIHTRNKSFSYLTPAALSTYRSIAWNIVQVHSTRGTIWHTQTVAKKATTKRF